jgi:hypothetical protein
MPVAGEGLGKGVTNGAAAHGEEVRGGEAPHRGELEAARGGEAGSGPRRLRKFLAA